MKSWYMILLKKIKSALDATVHQIGEDKSEKLEFTPAQVKVIEHVHPKYACRACEKVRTHSQINPASVPASIIPKGYATPSLLSLPTVQNYYQQISIWLTPYRQESMFKQYGIDLSCQAMAQWMIKSQVALHIL
jgi:transposase